MPRTGVFLPKCAMSPFLFPPLLLLSSLFPLFLFLARVHAVHSVAGGRGEGPSYHSLLFSLFFFLSPSPSRFLFPLFNLFLLFLFFFFFSFFFGSPRCPSEKSINLACGLANVRTIRQRADWWEGMDSWRPRWWCRRRGSGKGRREGESAAEAVSGERCSFASHMQ